MWSDLNPHWQRAFALAWESFCAGTVPVGCVIVDEERSGLGAGFCLL